MKRFEVKKFGFNDFGVMDCKWGVRTAFFTKGFSEQELNIYVAKLNKKRGY